MARPGTVRRVRRLPRVWVRTRAAVRERPAPGHRVVSRRRRSARTWPRGRECRRFRRRGERADGEDGKAKGPKLRAVSACRCESAGPGVNGRHPYDIPCPGKRCLRALRAFVKRIGLVSCWGWRPSPAPVAVVRPVLIAVPPPQGAFGNHPAEFDAFARILPRHALDVGDERVLTFRHGRVVLAVGVAGVALNDGGCVGLEGPVSTPGRRVAPRRSTR